MSCSDCICNTDAQRVRDSAATEAAQWEAEEGMKEKLLQAKTHWKQKARSQGFKLSKIS